MKLKSVLLLIALNLFVLNSFGAVCEDENFSTHVSGESQCLVMRQYGSGAPEVMVVWLHGDVSTGGPANYHFRDAERFSRERYADKVVSVALVRPGYEDGAGNKSTVAFLHSARRDHYTKVNLIEVGTAIERLKDKFKPKRVVVVGHSGGAVTFAALLGIKPDLADAAVLVGCACDFEVWRAGRRPLALSENPMKWVASININTRVIALTGELDDNTFPRNVESYVAALQGRKIDAEFRLLGGYGHNESFRSPEVFRAVQSLLTAK